MISHDHTLQSFSIQDEAAPHMLVSAPRGNRNAYQKQNNSETALVGRLRACSEGQKLGLISPEEKATIKKLILSRDPRLQDEFHRALSAGDWTTVRYILNNLGTQIGSVGEEGVLNQHMAEVSLESESAVTMALKDEEFSRKLFEPIYEDIEYANSDQTEESIPIIHNSANISIQDPDVFENISWQSRKRQAFHSRDARMKQLPDMQTGVQPKSSKRKKPERKGQVSSRLRGLKPEREGSLAQSVKSFTKSANIHSIGNISPLKLSTTESKETISKIKKNERERKRRLAVTKGFDDLANLLKPFDQELGRPHATKIDKATLLRNTIDTIQSLQKKVEVLEIQNKELIQQTVNHK